MSNKQELESIKKQFQKSLNEVQINDVLQQLRVEYLGKKGIVTALLSGIGNMSETERRTTGAEIHKLREYIKQEIDKKVLNLKAAELEEKLLRESIDISLPGHDDRVKVGKKHILTHTIECLSRIMMILGFEKAIGKEIETNWYNFTALNVPRNHPARQMQDTFYAKDPKDPKKGWHEEDSLLLRTHTSTVQIHHMQNHKPPIKIFSCGRVYRADYDVTHTPMFHQIEGLYIDTDVTFAHLKAFLEEFLKLFFELDKLPIRFRSSYFPFTEPSAEVDVQCDRSAVKCTGGIEIGIGV